MQPHLVGLEAHVLADGELAGHAQAADAHALELLDVHACRLAHHPHLAVPPIHNLGGGGTRRSCEKQTCNQDITLQVLKGGWVTRRFPQATGKMKTRADIRSQSVGESALYHAQKFTQQHTHRD